MLRLLVLLMTSRWWWWRWWYDAWIADSKSLIAGRSVCLCLYVSLSVRPSVCRPYVFLSVWFFVWAGVDWSVIARGCHCRPIVYSKSWLLITAQLSLSRCHSIAPRLLFTLYMSLINQQSQPAPPAAHWVTADRSADSNITQSWMTLQAQYNLW